MSYEGLVQELREYAKNGNKFLNGWSLYLRAAAAIEILDRLCDRYEAELDRVAAERDAAVKDIEEAIRLYRDDEGWTLLCKFCSVTNSDCSNECHFKWRGVQEGDKNEMA